MEVKSIAKTVRVPARKARLVLDTIRGKDAKEALALLKFETNYAAEVSYKVLKSAIYNAVNNHQMSEDKLFVKACYADEGITMKRYKAAAKGSAHPIMKRTSHITIVVDEH